MNSFRGDRNGIDKLRLLLSNNTDNSFRFFGSNDLCVVVADCFNMPVDSLSSNRFDRLNRLEDNRLDITDSELTGLNVLNYLHLLIDFIGGLDNNIISLD